jgi:CubicO group peptidase (beta-lactamase class C family)
VLFAAACKDDPTAAPARTPEVLAPVDTGAYDAGVMRLHELLAVINSGDPAAMKAYLQTSSFYPPFQTWNESLLPLVLSLYRNSTGLELVRVAKIGVQQIAPVLAGHAAAVLRNKATGDEFAMVVYVESQPPHRIVHLPALHPSLSAALVQPPASVAAPEPQKLQEIGSYLRRLADADIFSGVVVIARDGQPVFSQAYGYADRERKIANTIDTPFLLGSMNKLFTGLAIGQLVEGGKLSYDDPLSKFLPDFPDPESAKKIRIKHLLSHTSGLAGAFPSPAWKAALDRLVTVQTMLDAAPREPLQFEPGAKWSYSNFGFIALGRVIEVVTGDDYYDYVAKNVFAPAGMTRASFPMLPRDGVATVPMAYPYEVEYDGGQILYVNKLGADFRRGSPAGSGVASASDLIALSSALQSGRVVRRDTYQLHSSAKPELGAPSYGYGFGVGLYTVAGRALVGHGGNALGECTNFGALRGTPYTIIVLSNLTMDTCVAVTVRIMRELALSQAAAG